MNLLRSRSPCWTIPCPNMALTLEVLWLMLIRTKGKHLSDRSSIYNFDFSG